MEKNGHMLCLDIVRVCTLTIWMEHFALERHLGRTQWIVWRKDEFCWKDASFEARSFRAANVENEHSCDFMIIVIVNYG